MLPVTATGTYGSQNYVLCPDGKVRYNAVGYGSAPPDFESLEAWKADCAENAPLTPMPADFPFSDYAVASA